MTSSTPFLIVIDDKRTDYITFGPTNWNTSTSVPWFNGTEQVPSFASQSSNQFGTLSMTFQGTAVAFIGITPTPFIGSQLLTVSIDGSEPTNTSYDDPNPPSYRQWYQSPTLSEGPHNISLSHIAGTSVDYAVVTVGQDSPLAGQIAIVDNEDPAITFKGNWQRSEWSFMSGESPGGLPFRNSTEVSTTIGDNLTFRFTGQSAAIYGIFEWSNLGLITLTFTLDDSSLSRTFQVTPTTPQFQTQFGQQPNFQFFSYDFLTPGNHTLTINVTDCVNQSFSLDYITFVPSFSTLATRPNLTVLTDTASTNLGSPHRKLSAGAISVIVMGVIVALLGGVLLLRWRPWKKKSEHKLINPFLPGRRDTETFPLRGFHLFSAPASIDHVNGQVTSGPRTAYTSMDSYNHTRHDSMSNEIRNTVASPPSSAYFDNARALHTSVISGYDQLVYIEDDRAATERGEQFSPPSYADSTR